MRSLSLAICIFLSSSAFASASPSLACEKKWGELEIYGKLLKRYRLRAENFPEGKHFRLYVKWYNGEEAEMLSYSANHKGHLILEMPEKKKDPFYALCPLKRGERIEFFMRSEEDSAVMVHASVVPFPNDLKTPSGIKLSLELQSHAGDRFLLRGEGFQPGETLEVNCQYQTQLTNYATEATADGVIEVPVRLELKENESGEALLILRRPSEKIAFPFQVGEPALEIAGACCLEFR